MEIGRIVERLGELKTEFEEYKEKALDETHEFSDEERSAYEGLRSEFDQLIERQTIHDTLIKNIGHIEEDRDEKRQNLLPLSRQSKNTVRIPKGNKRGEYRDFDRALTAWFTKDHNETAQRSAQRMGIDLNAETIDFELPRHWEQRDDPNIGVDSGSVDVTVDWSEGVESFFVRSLAKAFATYGSVRSLARIVTTNTGGDMIFPLIDDRAVNVTLLAEGSTTIIQERVSTGLTLQAFKFASGIKVTQELLTDMSFDAPSEVGLLLGERMARGLNIEYTTGAGTTRPLGASIASQNGVNLGSAAVAGANPITPDEIIDLFHALDPSYRGSATWMMHDVEVAKLRKLAGPAGTGIENYLWQPGLQAGHPDMLLGRPISVNNDMPDTVTGVGVNDNVILFGDFNRYLVREVRGVRLVRTNERYVEFDEVGFFIFMRTDANLLDPSGGGTNTPIMNAEYELA